jgi:hypothetical protein
MPGHVAAYATPLPLASITTDVAAIAAFRLSCI